MRGAAVARRLLRGMWRARRRTLVEYFVSRARARLDRTASRDGPVLLHTTHWQESSVVEHQCMPQSSALRHPGKPTAAELSVCSVHGYDGLQ